MSDLNLPKLFNHELNSIYQAKPPVSRAKMASITKQALNAIKYYKHVVIAVEKFIAKCRPEYKLPGLYVIDSIVRQSQYQHGNKDVYGPRFSKNFQTTFENLFQCREEDKPKIVRVLNLWQKNDIYTPDVIQPLMRLASQNRGSLGEDSTGSASSFNHSQSSAMEAVKKPAPQSFQSSSTGSAGSKGMADLKGNSDAALIIQQQQQKIEELMQQQQQLLQAQALQSLLGQNPVLAAAAAAVAVKDKADNSIVSLLQEQQNQLNQLETLKNQLSSQFEPPAPEPVPPKPYKESTSMSGHPTEFNKALLDDFDYSDDEEDMTQRIQRQRKQVEEQQTRLQDSSSVPDMEMLAQLQEQFRRNEHKHILTGGVGSTDASRMHEDANVDNDPGFHTVSSLSSIMQMPPPHHHQQPPSMPHHHHHHEPPPSHLPPQRSLSPEPFPPLPPHRRNQPPPPPHFEDSFPLPPQQCHDNVYPMPPPPPSHRSGNGFHDNHHHSPPPSRFNDEPFYHGDHRFPPRERRRSRSPVPPPGGRSRSPLPPPPRGRSRSPLPPHGRRSRSPLPLHGRRSRSPPHGRSRSPHPPGGRSRRWDRDSRGRRSRSPRSRSPPPASMQPQQQVRGYPHNTWEPTHPDLEPPQPPPPPPKVEWRGKEIPSPKPKHYSVCSTTIWVGRLPKGITKLQLEEAFKEFGPVHSVEMVVQRGCAYVCMVYRADTVRARNGLMNAKIGGTYCKLAWAPGKGVKGSDYKSYWSSEDGASFIPWELVKEADLEGLAVGGVIDPETYPPGVKPLPPPKSKEETTAPLPPQDQAAPPTTSIGAQPPMAPQMIPSMPPPPIPPPPQQAQTFQPPMHIPPPPGNMMPPPPGGPFGAAPPPAHLQGPPPPMGGPPPNMRPPFSQPGPPPQFSAPIVSPTFGGGHQIEMQFGAPQMNMQQIPPPSGHQMEVLRQPPPTSIPPPQMKPNQFLSTATGQNLPPDTPGEHQMESQQQEQAGQESEHQENDTATKPVEPSATENDDGDKMDICDTWEQEKVQRLAEEVEKFEQEVMNIERNSSKTAATDGMPAETNNKTEAERTVDADSTMVTERNEKDSVDKDREVDTDLSKDSKVVKEAKEELSHVNESKVKTGSQEGMEKLSKVEANSRITGEGEDSEAKQPTTEATDNPLTSEQNGTPAEATNVERETKQNVDEKSIPAAETNETALLDDAMDLQVSSPDEPAPQLTTDNV